MESSMVKSFANSNLKIIKDFFKNNLIDYEVITESTHGPYWYIKLSKDDIAVSISGDIGFSIEIFINKSKYELWQYDKSINGKIKTNNENILYQLNVLKLFLINI